MSGLVEGWSIAIGNRKLLQDMQVTWDSRTEEHLQRMENAGKIVTILVVEGKVEGLIALADKIQAQAKQSIARLKKIGIDDVIMISGDNRRAVESIARELSIDRIYSNMLPEDKLKVIRDLQNAGKKVAFVGDGVNDAPALAAADLGIAIHLPGNDIALEAADIGLMTGEIERIADIIDLSRKALRVIRANVLFSMSVNLFSVILGGLGVIGPVAGALLHETSALPVLANSARLIRHHNSMVK